MFAAASNDGREMAFPARVDEIIAINGASSNGEALEFNPGETGDKSRFTALGEDVLAAWPISPKNKTGVSREGDTSSTTPLAAAIAALII